MTEPISASVAMNVPTTGLKESLAAVSVIVMGEGAAKMGRSFDPETFTTNKVSALE